MPSILIDETHDPARESWVESANGHGDFPIQNLPLGVFSRGGDAPRGGVAIGDMILDLGKLALSGLLKGPAADAAEAAAAPSLNAMLALGAEPRRALRRCISALLAKDAPERAQVEPMLVPMAEVQMHLPAHVSDYTDFYVGIHHATNIGSLFRPDNPLLPNYKHVPIGYHGRASTIRPTGAEVIRPQGQTKAPTADAPSFGPIAKLDYELELGVWMATGNDLGTRIPIGEALDHVAGLTLLNDWSARDIQAWEYQPLGPFLAKNFLTTVSPWLITLEALAPFRRAQPPRPEGDPQPLPYLWDEADLREGAFSLDLEVYLSSAAMREKHIAPMRLSHGPASNMYWTIAQMVAHHASNGCQMQTGDLLGSGTISGPEHGSQGSLMEITRNGKDAVELPTGETRTFLEDGDELSLAGRFTADGAVSIGFGQCTGVVAPAKV
ncbi:fumarylacetoacetase [Novosphingobium mangrovi (ex Huang et al. 2023)]|uniref:fumarylacetoacetase n=1 Tax=Novosphingobium mangrovi (ex Huang et al. 2023) TaxID=2976432 RepID=A0ABT2I5V3_9SPHN|nr:fumarylacetoacetase [Novosphingobium mangrovi (ex Huang et al. 2023)]MCT2400195.1 fumarylacetoacetase [Novosphingobium mangrovi (ex Huang et al. 2023)]